jgi:hypothetical protein
MTAASLIDAIITHQINQSSSEPGNPGSQAPNPPPRPGDRLFQVNLIFLIFKFANLYFILILILILGIPARRTSTTRRDKWKSISYEKSV